MRDNQNTKKPNSSKIDTFTKLETAKHLKNPCEMLKLSVLRHIWKAHPKQDQQRVAIDEKRNKQKFFKNDTQQNLSPLRNLEKNPESWFGVADEILKNIMSTNMKNKYLKHLAEKSCAADKPKIIRNEILEKYTFSDAMFQKFNIEKWMSNTTQ